MYPTKFGYSLIQFNIVTSCHTSNITNTLQDISNYTMAFLKHFWQFYTVELDQQETLQFQTQELLISN